MQGSGTTVVIPEGLAPSFENDIPTPSSCSLDALRCGAQEGRFRGLTIAVIAATVLLLALYFIEIARAMWRIGKQLYMPLHHIAILLTVEV